MKEKIFILGLIGVISIFFWKFFTKGFLPIPADALVGLYHPFRDFYSAQYPSGLPFKNFLLTDPVRQQFPWRELGMSLWKRGELPLWNPYNFAGTSLLANFQSAAFSPLNFVFFLLPFPVAWSVLVLLQPILAGFFTYLYLIQIGLGRASRLLGGLVFAFSGFSVAWMEWNTILHTALWLPLVLFSIEKVSKIFEISRQQKIKNKKQRTRVLWWGFVFIGSLTSSFFAGHLQIFFYLWLVSLGYAGVKVFNSKGQKLVLSLFFVVCYLFFVGIAAIQWLPTLRLIQLSSREVDIDWQAEGWFIPFRHLVQFFAPDFFGNPSTLNYWGVWNYAEMVGYIGVLPLIFAFLAFFGKRDWRRGFFGALVFFGLILATDNPVARLPFQLGVPFVSTAQPTRLLFLVDFSLAVLAGFGLERLLKGELERRRVMGMVVGIGLLYLGLWSLTLLEDFGFFGTRENREITRRNLILPTVLFLLTAILVVCCEYFLRYFKKNREGDKLQKNFLYGPNLFVLFVTGLVIIDLFRFGWKFTPFSRGEYLFPWTETIKFLQENQGIYRYMTTDKRILSPNTNLPYRLYTVDGYDPLYLKTYGELVAAWERNTPNVSPPWGFNRQIQPMNFESRIADLLGVKYVLSLNELNSKKLVKVFEEGQTKVYENENVFPRAFLVESIEIVKSKKEAIEEMFDGSLDLRTTAIVLSDDKRFNNDLDKLSRSRYFVSDLEISLDYSESVEMVEYLENKVRLKVKTKETRMLVLTDSYYPSWEALIDGQPTKIYRVDYNFRGVIVPQGESEIIFQMRYL